MLELTGWTTKTNPSPPGATPSEPPPGDVLRTVNDGLKSAARSAVVLKTLPDWAKAAGTIRITVVPPASTGSAAPFSVSPAVLEKSGNDTVTGLCDGGHENGSVVVVVVDVVV